MSITEFQKLVTVSIWMFNNLLLNKSCGILPQYKNYLTINTISWIFRNKLTMGDYEYEPKSSQSLTSQPLFRTKYFENESYIFSMFVFQDRHKFVLILVNWLTEKIICYFISRSFSCGIMTCYISGTMCKLAIF